MRFDIMTLFPELVDSVLGTSIIGRAQAADIIKVKSYNIRDYSEDRHRRVDDTPYGGGKGMLMAAPPIYNCYAAVAAEEPTPRTRVIFMSPKGRLLTQEYARELSESYDRLIILCGHYEGVDQRVIDEIIDEELSVGDYVLTGGELPACILVDCISRLIDGVLADPECYESESLSDGLLEYPQYTRPYEWHGQRVPDVLISGHHQNIDKWRHERSLELTESMRPDLIKDKK